MRADVLAVAFAALLGSSPAAALNITYVSHQPPIFDPNRGEEATVRFNLSEPARVTLRIYDARDLLIRSTQAELAAGDQELRWDGRDQRGQIAPPEAYIYTLEAESRTGEQRSWDIADSAGETLPELDIAWDPQSARVRYELSDLARVRIRIGLANDGPLLRTLIDWVPRTRGTHTESWDGKGASGNLDLATHPGLIFDGRAFALPGNAIVVGPPTTDSTYLELSAHAPKRESTRAQTHRMFDFARQPAEERNDFPLQMTLPAELEKTPDGLPIVRGPVPLRITVPDEAYARVVNQRSEAVLYVDGSFAFERETGFLPLTWIWDPEGHAPGLHHLTANLRGYEGQFGVGTLRVWVEAAESAKR